MGRPTPWALAGVPPQAAKQTSGWAAEASVHGSGRRTAPGQRADRGGQVPTSACGWAGLESRKKWQVPANPLAAMQAALDDLLRRPVQGQSGVAVDFAQRPLWLPKGLNRSSCNGFKTGHWR